MTHIKNNGILYKKNKIPKFQAGSTFSPDSFQYGDGKLFGDSGSSFGNQTSRAIGFGGQGQAPSLGKQFNPNSFKSWENKVNPTIGKAAPVKPQGYNFGGTKASDLSLTKPLIPELASNHKYTGPEAPKADGSGIASAGTIASTVAPIAGAAGTALMNKNDGDATTFTGKEKANLIAGKALKTAAVGSTIATTAATLAGTALTTSAATAVGLGASAAATGALAGSVVPLIGTAIGLAVGAVVGIFMSKKAKKKAKEAKRQEGIKLDSIASAKRRAEVSERDAAFAAGPITTAKTQDAQLSGYLSRKNGGSFHYTLKESTSPNRLYVLGPQQPKRMLKKGGRISPTENIIPNGVLHEEFNKLGDKGMPVVKCVNNSCEKKYEIERDEMIFTLESTKAVENLIKSGDLKKLGKYVKNQVLDNTHSFTEKYNDLNTYNKKQDESIFN